MFRVAILIGTLSVLSAACEEDECSDTQREKDWCEDNTLMSCYRSSLNDVFDVGENKLRTIDCTEYDKVCFENDRGAYCGLPQD